MRLDLRRQHRQPQLGLAALGLGLGEGAFPARDTRDTLDLRLERRQVGDVRASERDKYMFLEVLLSARDALSVSWVARDPHTGDAIPPSPVVGLLMDTLRRSYLSAEEAAGLVERHALFRHEPLDPGSPFAEAHTEAWLRQLGRLARVALRGRDAQGTEHGAPPDLGDALHALRGRVPAEHLATLQRELRTISLADGWRADAAGDATVPVGLVTQVSVRGGQDDEDVLIVSSGGPIATAIARVLGTPPEVVIDLNMRMRNTAISELAITPRRLALQTYNTLPHLDGDEHRAWITYA